jgi:hypothetical protein
VDRVGEIVDLVEPVLIQEFRELPPHDGVRRRHAVKVAQDLGRESDARRDNVEHVLVGLPGLVQLQDREADALLEDVGGVRRERAAADIGQVGDRARIGDDLPVPEDRRHHGHVRQVPGADLGIVGGEHVAGHELLGGVSLEEVLLNRDREGGDEDRDRPGALGERSSPRIHQHGDVVVVLAHDRREGGAAEDAVRLVGDEDETVPHHLERDRVVEERRIGHR